MPQRTKNKAAVEPGRVPTASAVFDDGAILEMLYRPEERRTAFALWRDGKWTVESGVNIDPLHRLVPYSPQNNLLQHEVVLSGRPPSP